MRHLITIVLMILPAVFFAQDLPKGQYFGEITNSDGSKEKGIINLLNESKPWVKQTKIFFYKTESIPAEKIKKRDFEKLKPEDLKGFTVGDRRFETIKYVNTSGASKGKDLNTINRISTMAKNLKTSSFFAEVYRSDKVSLYRFYNAPPPVSVSSGEETEELKRMEEEARTNYDILIMKEGEKAKSFNDISIKKYFSDCDYVVKKFKKKEYRKKPLKGLKTMMANAMLYGDKLAEAASEIIDDYIQECK